MSKYVEELRERVEKRLAELLQIRTPELLWDSMAYSVQAGGKRLRPVLHLMAAELKGSGEENLDIACAIEMIHTYSLIHDDLPALDNDTPVSYTHLAFCFFCCSCLL